MNVQDIRNDAIKFTGTTVNITPEKAIAAMQIAMLMIADKSGYDFETSPADYTANTWYTDVLPANNLGVTTVNITNSDNAEYIGWRRRGRDMLFFDSGNYIIHYKALPTEPTSLESELQCHDIYKDALIQFMVGYARQSKWEGKDPYGAQLTEAFRGMVFEKWRIINGWNGPKQMRVIRHR